MDRKEFLDKESFFSLSKAFPANPDLSCYPVLSLCMG